MIYHNTVPDSIQSASYAEVLLFDEANLTRGKDERITDKDLKHIAEYFTNLWKAGFRGVPDIADSTLISLLRAKSGPGLDTSMYLRLPLTSLDITNCKNITIFSIRKLALCAPGLKALFLKGASMLGDNAVNVVAESFEVLETLDLSELQDITARSVASLWKTSVSKSNDKSICVAQSLKKLVLAKCERLSDKAFPHPAPSSSSSRPAPRSSKPTPDPEWDLCPLVISSSACFSRLVHLDISYCPGLTDTSIQGLIPHTPNLGHVNLSGCPKLTGRAVDQLRTLGTCLHTLVLAGLPLIKDENILGLATVCLKLGSVDISGCKRLTDVSVARLSILRDLSELMMNKLPLVTDEGIDNMFRRTPRPLKRLEISHCINISLTAIHILLKRLTCLSSFTASGIPSLNRIGIQHFSDCPPKDYNEGGPYRVFNQNNIRHLKRFLDREEERTRAAHARGVPFVEDGRYEWRVAPSEMGDFDCATELSSCVSVSGLRG